MVIALRVGQFWSEIKLVITNRTTATRLCDFVITRLISDQIALHSVQLPLYIGLRGSYLHRNIKKRDLLGQGKRGRSLNEKETQPYIRAPPHSTIKLEYQSLGMKL